MGSSSSKSFRSTGGGELCALAALPPAFELHLQFLDLPRLQRLIRKGRLAPMLLPTACADADSTQCSGRGGGGAGAAAAAAAAEQDEEHDCPICCVGFPAPQNHASCCGAHLCTQCFVLSQVASDAPGQAPCPFCKAEPFSVQYLGGALPAKQKQKQQQKQHKQHKQQAAGSTQRAWQALLPSWRRSASSEHGSSPDAVPAAARDTSDTRRSHEQQQQHDQQRPSGPGSWLQQLTSSRRRVQSVSVLAGFSHDGMPPQEQPAAAAGVAAAAPQEAAPAAEPELPAAAADDAAAAAAHEDAAAAAATEQRLLQLAELSQMADAGLLPAYAAVELSGLHPEELEEILVEQALLASLRSAGAAQQAASGGTSSPERE